MAKRAWVLILVLLVGACSSGDDRTGRAATPSTTTPAVTTSPPSGPFVPAPLQWRECGAGECADLDVPLDYDEPAGRHITLAVARAVTAKSDARIGSLVLNPGGPGAPGVDSVSYAAGRLPPGVTDRFDLVSWDPRGSGASAPVDCGSRLDYLFAVDSAPDDPEELGALEAAAQRFVAACVERSGELLGAISTRNTVRDLESLRVALGEPRLNYLGLSYGTVIGGLYASAYPQRIRAMVLDGAVDPTVAPEDIAIEQAQAFDASLQRFFEWCGSQGCSFARGGNPRTAYNEIARAVDAEPIASGADRFGPTQLVVGVAALLYSGTPAYRTLAGGLRDVQRGAPGALQSVYDDYVGRDHGEYDTQWASFIAISCADGPNLPVAAMEAVQRRAAIEAPVFGAGNVGLGYPCSYWPNPPDNVVATPFVAPGTPPVLVVGTRGDPATPVAWAEGLARQLANARLLLVDDVTHTASLNGDACVDRVLAAYFEDPNSPPVRSACP